MDNYSICTLLIKSDFNEFKVISVRMHDYSLIHYPLKHSSLSIINFTIIH